MAKRKKRFTTHHPEAFERLDEEFTKALDNLVARNRETEAALGTCGSTNAEPPSENVAPEEATGQQEEHDGDAQ
jgi:hypothetical protein